VLVPGILYKDSTPSATSAKEKADERAEASKAEADKGVVNIDEEMAQIEKEILELENQTNDTNAAADDEAEMVLTVDENGAEDEVK
jgi:hypothetical protein